LTLAAFLAAVARNYKVVDLGVVARAFVGHTGRWLAPFAPDPVALAEVDHGLDEFGGLDAQLAQKVRTRMLPPLRRMQ
jgi:hypothetical protein